MSIDCEDGDGVLHFYKKINEKFKQGFAGLPCYGDRYQALLELGKGSFGDVSFCLLVKDLFADEDSLEILKVLKIANRRSSPPEELNLLPALRHENIISVFDVFTEADFYGLAMEFCMGSDLRAKIDSQRREKQPFQSECVLDIFGQLLEGLAYLHGQKVIHRNLKPSNIFLTRGVAKIADFGADGKAQLEDVTEKPFYSSPELFEGKSCDSSTDSWSLGCILYELCTLEPAFVAGSLLELKDALLKGPLPKIEDKQYLDLGTICESLLQREPDYRPEAEILLRHPLLLDLKHRTKTIILFGCPGSGKSQLGNLLASDENAFRVHRKIHGEHSTFRSIKHHLNIIDSVELYDTNDKAPVIRAKLWESLAATRRGGGLDWILFCMKFGKLTDEQYEEFETVVNWFGDDCCSKNLILVVTHAGDLAASTADDQNQWLNKQQDNHDRPTARNFTRILNICNRRVVFVENLESTHRKYRKTSLNSLLAAINVKPSQKVIPEAARRQQELAQRRELEIEFAEEEARRQRAEEEISRKGVEADVEKLRKTERLRQLAVQRVLEDEQVKLGRFHVHELFCRRKNCLSWRSLLQENVNSSLASLWNFHVESCLDCKQCRVCFLENKAATDRAEKEKFELDVSHREELEKLLPSKRNNSSLCCVL